MCDCVCVRHRYGRVGVNDPDGLDAAVSHSSEHVDSLQAGRLGPIQYDLASLLIDPYVELPKAIQTDLRSYCLQELSKKIAVEPDKFLHCFKYCCLTRNLQILGAFAFLSKVKGKHYFEDHIPAAFQSLKTGLRDCARNEFPVIEDAVATAGKKLRNRTNNSEVKHDTHKGNG